MAVCDMQLELLEEGRGRYQLPYFLPYDLCHIRRVIELSRIAVGLMTNIAWQACV